MWKHRKRMIEDEDDFYTDDPVFDEDEPPSRPFWQNLFGSKVQVDDEDDCDDTLDDFDDAPPPGKSVGKHLLLLGCAAMVIAITVMCFRGVFRSDANALHRALTNSGAALSAYMKDSSRLCQYVNQMEVLVEDGNFTANLTMDTAGGAVSLNMDYSRNQKLMSGVFNWNNGRDPDGWDVAFSADKKELRLSAPTLVEDVYGFRFDNFKESKGHLAALLAPFSVDISLPEKKMDPFSPVDLDKLLKDSAGESWTAFKKTLEIKEFTTRDVQLGGLSRYCTIYQISWDPAAADRLARDLSGMLTAIPVGIVTLLPNMKPDCRLFVDEHNQVVGGDCSILGKKYTILMTGETNFCEDISVEILSATEPARYLTGGIEATETGIGLRLSDDIGDFLSASYDNATGAFRISTADTMVMEGSLLMTGDTVKMELDAQGDLSLCLELSPLSRRPVVDRVSYVDISSMSLNEFNRIVMEINNNLRK